MNILHLIATSNFITVNRTVASIVGLEAAVILGELASEAAYWSEHNPEYDGSFYSTIENLEARTYLSAHNQRLALNKLQEQGWITVEKRGMPARRFIRINEEEISRVVNNKSFKILTTRDSKNERQVVQNFNTNNNINNNNRKEEMSKGEELQDPETYQFQNRPATREDFQKIIDILFTACPYIRKQITKQQARELLESEFRGVKANILHEAVRNHIRTNGFYPKMSELHEQIRRAEVITAETRRAPEDHQPKPENIPEDIKNLFAEFD